MSPSRQTLAGFFNPAPRTARVAETTSERPSPGKSSDENEAMGSNASVGETRLEASPSAKRAKKTNGNAETTTRPVVKGERTETGAPVASVEEAEEAADERVGRRRRKRSVDASRRRRLSDGEDDEDDVRASEEEEMDSDGSEEDEEEDEDDIEDLEIGSPKTGKMPGKTKNLLNLKISPEEFSLGK